VGLAIGWAVPRYPRLGALGVAVAAAGETEVGVGVGPAELGDVGDADGVGPWQDGQGCGIRPPRVGDGTGDAVGTGVDVEASEGTGDGAAAGDEDSPAKPILTRPG
jgi:hypothetical protein